MEHVRLGDNASMVCVWEGSVSLNAPENPVAMMAVGATAVRAMRALPVTSMVNASSIANRIA